MTKRIFIMLFLLALAGVYAMTATARDDGGAPDPTQTARIDPPSPTVTPFPPETCKVNTGIEDGTVNLRACAGAACGPVLDILTEGETLRVNIITAGESTGYASLYVNVTTESGVSGWLNSKYCKKENKP